MCEFFFFCRLTKCAHSSQSLRESFCFVLFCLQSLHNNTISLFAYKYIRTHIWFMLKGSHQHTKKPRAAKRVLWTENRLMFFFVSKKRKKCCCCACHRVFCVAFSLMPHLFPSSSALTPGSNDSHHLRFALSLSLAVLCVCVQMKLTEVCLHHANTKGIVALWHFQELVFFAAISH